MNELDLPTPALLCFQRLTAGDPGARAEFLGFTRDRLWAMTRAMMNGFPGLRRWEGSEDVVQNAMIRLDRALSQVQIQTPVEYVLLAATNIRRELIDLTRHYYGPEGMGTHHANVESPQPLDEIAIDQDDPAILILAVELHEKIEALPPKVRDVVHLRWYMGMTIAETAAVLGVSVQTVNRLSTEAKELLDPQRD